jgi:hypothetical protein
VDGVPNGRLPFLQNRSRFATHDHVDRPIDNLNSENNSSKKYENGKNGSSRAYQKGKNDFRRYMKTVRTVSVGKKSKQ